MIEAASGSKPKKCIIKYSKWLPDVVSFRVPGYYVFGRFKMTTLVWHQQTYDVWWEKLNVSDNWHHFGKFQTLWACHLSKMKVIQWWIPAVTLHSQWGLFHYVQAEICLYLKYPYTFLGEPYTCFLGSKQSLCWHTTMDTSTRVWNSQCQYQNQFLPMKCIELKQNTLKVFVIGDSKGF